jgi:hypothetical protein
MNIETIYESFVETYRNVGQLISELKQSTIDSALEKRKAQRKKLVDAQSKLTDQGRIHGRRGSSNTPGSGGDTPAGFSGQDRIDIDQQVTSARAGASGEKDEGIAVPDSQRSALERRHVPPTRDGKGGETLYSKLTRRIGNLARHRGTK